MSTLFRKIDGWTCHLDEDVPGLRQAVQDSTGLVATARSDGSLQAYTLVPPAVVRWLMAPLLRVSEERGAAPFVALMLWARDNYRSVVVEKTGPEEVVLSWLDENDSGGVASGSTATAAATKACDALGLHVKETT